MFYEHKKSIFTKQIFFIPSFFFPRLRLKKSLKYEWWLILSYFLLFCVFWMSNKFIWLRVWKIWKLCLDLMLSICEVDMTILLFALVQKWKDFLRIFIEFCYLSFVLGGWFTWRCLKCCFWAWGIKTKFGKFSKIYKFLN